MPRVLLSAPSLTSAPQKTFRAHSNYLRAFARISGFELATTAYLEKAHKEIQERTLKASTFRSLTRRKCDTDQVAASLGNAWGTELLLGLSGRYAVEDALVRLTNNWGVVQLYYVGYHAAQALFVARTGQPRPESHPATQRDAVDYWAGRAVDLPPWSLAIASDGYHNWPDPPDEKAHPWQSCTAKTCWDLAALALRGTRKDAVAEALRRRRAEKQRVTRREWQTEEDARTSAGRKARPEPRFPKANLNVQERADVEARVRPYGLLDYLYRLRVKTNYDDSMMFTEGPLRDADSVVVHNDMTNLASTTLLVHELHIRELIGVEALRRIVDRWIQANHFGTADLGITTRRDLLVAAA